MSRDGYRRKVGAKGRLVSGLKDDGPGAAGAPPKTLEQMTKKKRLVSIAFAPPHVKQSHQPDGLWRS